LFSTSRMKSYQFLLRKLKCFSMDAKIQRAKDYGDIIDPMDESEPEYLILEGVGGKQILVSVPSFSEHIITVQAKGETAVGLGLIAAVLLGLVIVALVVTRAWRFK
jgi:hypothetical protein